MLEDNRSATVPVGCKPSKYKVAIIAPTCFYYQIALFRTLSDNDRIDLTVYFCSDEGVSGTDLKVAYRTNNSWGVENELLEGYQYKFLRNHVPQGSYLKSLTGLVNLGVWRELDRERPDAVVIMSWMNPTWWLTYLCCLKFRIPVFYMTDANFYAEGSKSTWKSWLKHSILGKFLFPSTAGFLCSGTANRQLYANYGVPEKKLIPFAYSWGYNALIREAIQNTEKVPALRKQHGIPQDAVVVLYCGRLSEEKGLTELLRAYQMLSNPKKALVLVGDGPLRGRMETLAGQPGFESVYFMGFQNRKNIGRFYALADLLVLPSHQETWGIVVNEALCFSLPVIVSDQVGSGVDLVIPGENGHIFPAGDVLALADRISKVIDLSNGDRIEMGKKSLQQIEEWEDRDLAKPLIEYLDSLVQARI
tara:strand:- start:3766 stop:5022 length:1257 start_codon:yes stop_codon:yes gene_type:complete